MNDELAFDDKTDKEQEKKEEEAKKKAKKKRKRYDTFVGTVNYLSPEVIDSEEHTFAIDMWALGTIFYKMLFGKVAFAGTNM